jgi:predicted GNAT family N-acyltransferase/predicted Zn-ribbon and HTH transcriptional regulator
MTRKAFAILTVTFEAAEEAIRRIRTEVYIQEQNVPDELEWDGEDPQCIHVLAVDEDGEAVGTARLTAGGKLGRMAVLKPWRGRGVGSAMVKVLTELARERGNKQVILDAQTRAIPFYEAHGYTAEGPEFMDADIPHRKMFLKLEPEGAQDPPPMTRRQRIVELLRVGPETVRSLAERMEMGYQQVARELEHVRKSLRPERLRVTPARCTACDMVFSKRDRLTRPSRCPRCKSERITDPEFWVE